MAQQTVAVPKLLTRQEIKELGGSQGMCLSLFLPVENGSRNRRSLSARLPGALQKAETQLSERSVATSVTRKLIDSIRGMGGQFDNEQSGETLVIYQSEEQLRHYWVPEKLPELSVVASNFHIRPFLRKIERETNFYLLALSQKDIRLLECTEHSSEEVDLGDRIPHSLLEDMATDQPDHVMDNRSSAGPSMGSHGKGVMFGTSTDREHKDENLTHFYKDVSKGVCEFLRGQEKTPLVLCGVEYELALFSRVNMWENTCPIGVKGAPNGLKGGEMHARALEALDQMYDQELEQLLPQHDKQTGELSAAGVNDLVKWSYEGRVMHLFAAENAQVVGNFGETTYAARTHVQPRPGDEDLINAAAFQTILHAGRVHVMPQARVPHNRPMAALMRY